MIRTLLPRRFWGALTLAFVGCVGDVGEPGTEEPIAELPPVLQTVLAEWNGDGFTFRPLSGSEVDSLRSQGVGAVTQPLVDLSSAGCVECTGSNYVGFSNIDGERYVVIGGEPDGVSPLWVSSTNCGPPPGGTTSAGVCQGVRIRNLYPQQLERVYVEVVELAPRGSTVSVQVPPSQPWAAADDFGASTHAPFIGLWRAGTIGRSSPPAGGVEMFWTFTGTIDPGDPEFRFRFVLNVRGQVVGASRRASVIGADSPEANYPALTQGEIVFDQNTGMSADGRYVVFVVESRPTRINPLVPFTPTQLVRYVVRHDMVSGENVIANMVDGETSIPETCFSGNPSISGDGNRIAFESRGCTLTPAYGTSTPLNRWQAYVRDVAAQRTFLASESSTGGYANLQQGGTLAPTISRDGNVVVWHSNATNLISGQPTPSTTRPNSCREVYRRDLGATTTTHVSAVGGTPINAASGFVSSCDQALPAGFAPDVSADGSLVVFESGRPLVADDTNSDHDIYVYGHGGATANVYRVSLSRLGAQIAPPTGFRSPSIAANGGFVAFTATADGIVTGSGGGNRHVYRRSTVASANTSIRRISVTPLQVPGTGGNNALAWPVVSDDGRFVAFFSNFTNLLGSYNPGGLSDYNYYTCDFSASSSDLNRCFLTSTYQATPTSPFVRMNGASMFSPVRTSIACTNPQDPCYVAFPRSAVTGVRQVWVSPVGDARYQMASPSQ